MRKPAVEAAGLFDLFALARDEDLDRILLTSMREITLTLETVTPMFLGGADPRGAPELRAPSFRGAMRYWLRAILGGVVGDGHLESLRKLESAVMGSTDYSSPIQIRLSDALSGKLKVNEKEQILPHRTDSARRKAFMAGQTFKLTMKMARADSSEELIWDCACAALSAMLTFGGVGLRARRGHGTLRISHAQEKNDFLYTFPKTKNDWEEHIKNLLTKSIIVAKRLAETLNIKISENTSKNLTSFPYFFNGNLIRISNANYNSSMDAVKHFMSIVPRNVAFGGINPRQSSPLWVRPIEVENGRFRLLLFLFHCKVKSETNHNTIKLWLDDKFPGDNINV